MKKLLLLALVAISSTFAFAQSTKQYTDTLYSVSAGGKSTPEDTYTASVERLADGKINLTIHNFYYRMFFKIAIGNIVLPNIPTTADGNILSFDSDVQGSIVNGDDKSVSWSGPSLMPKPKVKISGKLDGEKLYFKAVINAPVVGDITVAFGKEDLVTAIRPTLSSTTGADVIYTLDGRRLDSAPQHGIFILNGKKVMR